MEFNKSGCDGGKSDDSGEEVSRIPTLTVINMDRRLTWE